MRPLWYPTAWSASFSAGGKTTPLKSVFPITESPGTKGMVITAPVIWVGLGTAADFLGRDVRGKTVMIYSNATPGGRDHSADWSGAIRRADEAAKERGLAAVEQVKPLGSATTRPDNTPPKRLCYLTGRVGSARSVGEAAISCFFILLTPSMIFRKARVASSRPQAGTRSAVSSVMW